MKVTWHISWKKLIHFGLTWVQILQTIYLAYLGSFSELDKENSKKCRKPYFSGKGISKMLFSWVRNDTADAKLPKVVSEQKHL